MYVMILVVTWILRSGVGSDISYFVLTYFNSQELEPTDADKLGPADSNNF